MERKELSNLELFVGVFKTEKSLIEFDEIKEHLLKSTARDIFKEKRLNGVPLKWEKNIHWLYEYIKDQFIKYDLSRQIINDINIYDLYGSPDYTILFPINGKATVSLFYDDNRHKDKSWHVDIEKNKYIIFNSTIKYDISRNEEKENRFILKAKTHIIY